MMYCFDFGDFEEQPPGTYPADLESFLLGIDGLEDEDEGFPFYECEKNGIPKTSSGLNGSDLEQSEWETISLKLITPSKAGRLDGNR